MHGWLWRPTNSSEPAVAIADEVMKQAAGIDAAAAEAASRKVADAQPQTEKAEQRKHNGRP